MEYSVQDICDDAKCLEIAAVLRFRETKANSTLDKQVAALYSSNGTIMKTAFITYGSGRTDFLESPPCV